MTIVQINAVYGYGSTGRNCQDLDIALTDSGMKVYSIYSVEPRSPPSNGYLMGSRIDHKLHALMSRISGLQGYYSKKSTNRLINILQNMNPDVVHLNNLHSNFIHLETLLDFLSKNDVPTVLTLHDCWFYTGKCTHYTSDNCYKWKNECGGCPRLMKDNPSWFMDQTSKCLSDKRKWLGAIPRLGIAGVSNWITQEAKSSILSSAKIIRTIYNWVDTDVFIPNKNTDSVRAGLGAGSKDFIILAVASAWVPGKGLESLIRFAAQLNEDEKLLVIGKLPKNIVLPKIIIHIDETHDVHELAGYYSAADVFISFSTEESFGKVTAEALSCGTPVVVMNSTANPELIGHGCGYVVDKNDFQMAIEAVQRIKFDGKNTYTGACRKFATENFSKEKSIQSYIRLFLELSDG